VKRGRLRTRLEIEKGLLSDKEKILWEGAPTVPFLMKFWIGVVIFTVGLIGYQIIRFAISDPALPYFIGLYLIVLVLPTLLINRVGKARKWFYYVTDQRIIMERGYRYRWLFLNEIDRIRISDRLSFVGFVGLEHIYFQTKDADKPYGRTPDKSGIIYALYEKNGQYYEYPPRPVTTDGFYYLKRGEAALVDKLVLELRSRRNSISSDRSSDHSQ
jgi:hypothetical protein